MIKIAIPNKKRLHNPSKMVGPKVSEVAPTVPMLAVNVVVDDKDVYKIISRAKKAWARDILVLPIERIVP